MRFFDEELLLYHEASKEIYKSVKALPIVDYHCHLNQRLIAEDAHFSSLGELWLAGDHYKWRAMRICGVDEKYITGDADYYEKFLHYAAIMPRLAGNPLYYWTHMELAQIFDIHEPLSAETAPDIYERANKVLKNLSVRALLKRFGVSYIATTDDPIDDLALHGEYDGITVRPTFRPDKLFTLDGAYLAKLSAAAGVETDTLEGLKRAISLRLDYFESKGCKISDHAFVTFPKRYASDEEAAHLYANRESLTAEQKDAFLGWILLFLTKEYARRGIVMQLHFAAIRNNNPAMYQKLGVDSGFDLPGDAPIIEDVVAYFAKTPDEARPETVLYTLNDSNISDLSAITGAFRHVRMGAAWWFNDTVEGIRRNLKAIGEYSVLGTSFGMLTDSRSFASYVRFDFFRRLLAEHLGELVSRGEYDMAAAMELAKQVCYDNIAKTLAL